MIFVFYILAALLLFLSYKSFRGGIGGDYAGADGPDGHTMRAALI